MTVEGYKESGEYKELIEWRKKTVGLPLHWGWEADQNSKFKLATMDFQYRIKGVREDKGWNQGLFLAEYSKEYYEGCDYFSLSFPPSYSVSILKLSNIGVWIRKKGVGFKSVLPDGKDFKKFKIPKELREKILPVLEETGNYNFFEVIKKYRKEHLKERKR